jgi:hypothetical protein
MHQLAITALLALVSASTPNPGDVRTSANKLRKVIYTANHSELLPAVQELAGWNNADAMKSLLGIAGKRPSRIDPAFWMEAYSLLLRGAAGMTDTLALQEASKIILRNKANPMSRDFLAMLSNQGNPAIVPPMIRILEDGPDDMRVVAAEHLATIGDKRAIGALVEALEDRKASGLLRRRVAAALSGITGKNYGDNATQWRGWWEANSGKDLQGPAASGSKGGGTVTLDRTRDSEWDELRKEARVLVLGAGDKCLCAKNHDLDNIKNICDRLGLSADFVDKVTFDKKTNPSKYIAILANCTMIRRHCACPQCKPGAYAKDRLFTCVCPVNKHTPTTYMLGDKGVQKIKRYVERGGYLFAEDWCMEDFVEKAFGKYIRHGSIRPKDEEVSVVAAPGAMIHPFLKKIFFKGFKPQGSSVGTAVVTAEELKEVVHTWKIDKETRTIKIVDPKRVVTILTSPELERSAQGDNAVAVTFAVGGKDGRRPGIASGGRVQQDTTKMTGGRVLYVLSHFGKQRSSEDEYSLQNLLINFLIEANERRATFEKAPKKRR